MVSLNERCWEIINILINSVKPLTINEIAEKLNVSNRTIRNDLTAVEDYIYDNNLGRVIKKPRVGVWLESEQDKRILLRNAFNKSKNYIQPYTSEERKFYIIKRLLLSSNYLTMQELAEELFVSKVTIFKDLEQAQLWLNKYNLVVKRKRNHGIEVEGEEKNWRKASAELLLILKNDEEIKDLLLKDENLRYSERVSSDYFKHLESMLPDVDLKKIESILLKAEDSMDILLTDEAFAGLLIHIAISIERLRQKKDIKIDYNQLENIQDKKEYRIATWIAKRIEEEFNIILPDAEIGYISLHILGAKIQESFKSNEVYDIIKDSDDKIVKLAQEIAIMVGNILSVDFSRDEKLLAGLILHLRPAINRLKYGMTLRNPILDEIKNNYTSIFGAAWTTSVLFEKFYGVKVNEEEIGYLALHIGAALVRLNEKTRAVIVCSSGIGTAQLVAERLQREISGLEIVDITSVYSLDRVKLTDFDILLSTIPVEVISEKYKSKPVIQISVFLSDSDISRIKKYTTNIENTRRFNEEVVESYDLVLFQEELTFVNKKIKNKEEAIDFLGKLLEKKEYVEKGFLKTVKERETLTSTSIGKGVAIPHGDSNLVKKPVIATAILDSPIKWGEDEIDIIFMLAFRFETGSETRRFFKKFYSILDNEEVLNSYRNANTNEELYKKLTGKD